MRAEANIRLLYLHEPSSHYRRHVSVRAGARAPAACQNSQEQSIRAAASRARIITAASVCRGVQWQLGSGLSRARAVDAAGE